MIKIHDEKVLRKAQLIMLKILKEFDSICRNNNLPYWLDSGTLLGAVRHKGFIPWDDDVDVCMLREDYEKFIDIAARLLPDNMILQTIFTDKHCLFNFAKIYNRSSFLVEFENQDPAFWQGIYIDIFPVDKLSKGEFARNFWRSFYVNLYYTFGRPERKRQFTLNRPNKRNHSSRLLNFLNMQNAARIENRLRKYATVNSVCSDDFVLGYGIGLYFWKPPFKYENIFPLQKIRFEDAQFFAPKNYDSYLTTLFGNTYMQLPTVEKRKQHASLIKTELNQTEQDMLNKRFQLYNS